MRSAGLASPSGGVAGSVGARISGGREALEVSCMSYLAACGSNLAQLIRAMSALLELALPDEFVPDGLRVLAGRRDGHDARVSPARRRTPAELRFGVQAG